MNALIEELLSKTQKIQITTATEEYIEDIKDWMRHGFGIQYDKTGHISYAGMWENDKMHGKGRVYNLKGLCQFEGYFKFGYRDGSGIEYFENGTTKESERIYIWEIVFIAEKKVKKFVMFVLKI